MESLPLDTKVSAKRGTTSHDCPEWDCPTPMKYFKTDLPSEVKHPLRFRNKEEDDLEYFRTDQPSEVGKHPLRLRNKEEDGLLQAQAIPDAGVEHFPRDSEESILKMALELQNIAAGYREEGKLDEAMKALEEALELQRRVHGEGHPDVAMLLSSMGELLNEQGKLKEAISILNQSLKSYRRAYGNESEEVANTLDFIGQIYEAQGKYEQAMEKFEKAILILTRVHGINHPEVADMHFEVAYRICNIPDGKLDSKYIQTASEHLTECDRIQQTLGSGSSRSRKRIAKLLLKVNDRKNLESARPT